MKTHFLTSALCLVLVSGNCCAASESPSEPTLEQAKFFNTKVRPLLESRCWKCHAADEQEGGLRLDSLAAALRGGDSGAAVVPGHSDESLLIEAVRYVSYEMPPDGKMPEGEVAILNRWVEVGAPWPKEDSAAVPDVPTSDPRDAINESSKTHWAFQPVTRPHVPEDADDDWSRNEVDRFVWQKMRENEITPSASADRRTLLRRMYLDLIGMPPTPGEAERFLLDDSGSEISKAVDELLDDPRYGERWARHWMDVARYADSKGAIFGETRQYPYAYTYRDYVIAAFNDDKPFDEFIREQLAADLIADRPDDSSLAALAFLTIHKRSNEGGIEEQRADRVDTVGRALLGLTVACARCHDHKYDPLTAADFYSLYGVFASIEEPEELPVIGRPDAGSPLEKSFLEFEAEQDRKLQLYRDENYARLTKLIRADAGKYLLMTYEGRDLPEGEFRTKAGREKLNPTIAVRWQQHLADRSSDSVFGPWTAFTELVADQFAEQAVGLAVKAAENGLPEYQLNPLVAAAFANQQPKSLEDVAAIYQTLFDEIEAAWTEHVSDSPTSKGFEDSDREQLRELLYGNDSPSVIPANDFRILDRPVFLTLIKKQADYELRLAMHPGSPRRAMIVRDTKKLYDPHIFIRGNKDRPGDSVPRQFIGLLAGENQEPFVNGAGRLELANAIVAPDNPLTARVIVNRVWNWHFGRGLVSTPSDFGLRSVPPSHPKLLDWLTSEFVDSGWSIKHLHRLIMNSATYQQSSHSDAEKFVRDPENEFLWRFNRRRLEYEAIHDSMLAVSGKLDPTRGGPASLMINEANFKPAAGSATWEFNPYRRAVYAAIERDKLSPLLLTFDFANPDETSAGRDITSVPTQSLYLLNGDFAIEMATALVAREEIANANDPSERIQRLYDRVLSRPPSAIELETALQFIQTSSADKASDVQQSEWAFGFAAYDLESVHHDFAVLKTFPHASPNALQGDEEFPDKKNGLGWLRLTPTGGHAGGGGQCLVRRWTSPISGSVQLSGLLKHSATQGDGVRATIYVGNEQIGQWTTHNCEADTRVERVNVTKGDQIAFVIDYFKGGEWDGFQWAPELTELTGDRQRAWPSSQAFARATQDQAIPAEEFGVWERLAQVLLMSNEFVFLE